MFRTDYVSKNSLIIIPMTHCEFNAYFLCNSKRCIQLIVDDSQLKSSTVIELFLLKSSLNPCQVEHKTILINDFVENFLKGRVGHEEVNKSVVAALEVLETIMELLKAIEELPELWELVDFFAKHEDTVASKFEEIYEQFLDFFCVG